MKLILMLLILVFLIVPVNAIEVTAYNLSVSDSLDFEQTFNASNVISLSINVADDATKSHPYDINTTGLVGWWKLDDDYLDDSGNGNNGTAYGDTYFVNGKYNNGSSFDGAGDVIKTDYIVPALLIDDGFTWSFHYYSVFDNPTGLTVLGNRYGGNQTPLQFIKFTPDKFAYYNNGLKPELLYTLPVGEHVFLMVVKDGADFSYYANNVLVDTGTTTINMDTNPFYIGADGYSTIIEEVNATIDNVMLHNFALSESERNNLYYDHLQQLQMKTNSNNTWSTEWNSTANNPIQVPYADGEFFSLLNFTVPNTVVQNEITIHDYSSTVQFDATATVESRLPGIFLYPNSTYSVGCYGKLISELVYETGFNMSDIGSCNALTTGDMEVLSVDDTNYILSIDKDAAHDGYMYGNFSLHDVETVNFINVKTVHNRVHTNPVILGLFNVSTQKWHAVNNSSVEIVDVELTYNITGTDILKYTTLEDNVLNLSVSLNTNGDGNYDVFVDFVEVYVDYEEVPCPTLECVYNLATSNQNNISILQNDVEDLKNNVNNLYLFVLLCTVFLVVALRKRGNK